MLTLVLGLGLSDAHADDDEPYVPAPRDRIWYSNATFLRVNPLGLVDFYKVGWRRRLSTKDSILFKDTYTYMAGAVMATPAYTRVGVFAEAQALAILRVFGQVDAVGYYGSFDQLLSWPTRDAVYSDQTMARLGDAGLAYAGGGWVATFGGTLRAAVGPVAVRSTPQFTRFSLGLRDDHVVFYDQYWDRLAPNGGWMILQDTDLLVIAGKARVGVRHTWTGSLAEAPGDGGLATHRVGPLFAWQFHDKEPGERFNQPTFFVLTQWWAQHAYRTGAEQPQGLPLIAAGFAFNGDLSVSNP